jgi:hypothetical protein
MEDIVLFKETVANILHTIRFPQNEIASYTQTLLENALTDTILDFADTLDAEERQHMQHIIKAHKSQSTFAELFSLMEHQNYHALLQENMKEQLHHFVASLTVGEPEKTAVWRMVEEYTQSFVN